MSSSLQNLEKKYIMQTYNRADVLFDRGKDCYVYDSNGKKYLDLIGGIATCTVGHGNQEVAKAVYKQAKNLTSVSNLYYMKPQILLAEKLSKISGLKKTFFCHSGADSNETAIKLAEKVTGKNHFIAFKQSFHGRTTGSLALTWKQEFKQPFLPLAPSVSFAEYNDIKSVKDLIKKDTAAVIVEPIQGEAGVVEPDKGFLKALRDLCDKSKLLLIIDEVQTGIGRTGKFFAYQYEDIKPDILTLAKGLANGIPIGACLSNFELEVGEHGSTLGGNNVSAAAALATIEFIEKHKLVKNAQTTGNYFISQLNKMKKDHPLIKSVRGKGLMVGIELIENEATDMVKDCLKLGLLCSAPANRVIRFLPPLIINEKQIDESIEILKEVLA